MITNFFTQNTPQARQKPGLWGVCSFHRTLPSSMVDGVLPFQDDLRNRDKSISFLQQRLDIRGVFFAALWNRTMLPGWTLEVTRFMISFASKFFQPKLSQSHCISLLPHPLFPLPLAIGTAIIYNPVIGFRKLASRTFTLN